MSSFKTLLGVLFGLLIIAIAVLSSVSYQYNERARGTVVWVSHSNRVIEQVNELATDYKSFLLQTHLGLNRIDTSYNTAYARTARSITHRLSVLQRLTRDNITQQQNLDSLATAFGTLRQITDWLIRMNYVHRSSGNQLLNTKSNSRYVKEVDSRIEHIRQMEYALLGAREVDSRTRHDAFRSMFIQLLVGIAALLGSTFFAVRYNLNQRVHTQEALSRTNELFGKVFYESPIAIVISDLTTGEILNCNKVFEQLVDFSADQLIGNTSADLGIFRDLKKKNGIAFTAKHTGTAAIDEAYIFTRKGEQRCVLLHVHQIRLHERTCLLTAFLDLSDHKKAKDEIRKALDAEKELNRLKSNFVTLASHEFRTPLTTILSSAFLLENYSFGENKDKAAKHLARIKSSVNNLTSILDDFLSVTKIEEGQVKPTLEKVNLPEYLATICCNLQAFAKPGQVIDYTYTGIKEVYTDPVLLENIVTTLLTNSIKFSGEDHSIYISSRVDETIQVTVRDNGMGIPFADQKHLFERFYRASNAGAIQGTGLGLYIMKHYVEMLQGSVSLTSEPGKGTQVIVTLAWTDVEPRST